MARIDPLVGQVLDGKYRLDARLGVGGMGAVYRATQLNLRRAVALKIMRGDFAADPTALHRFEREALTVASLKHPHIVTIHDFGVAPGTGVFLVMELLAGQSLRALLDARGPLAAPLAIEIVEPICSALDMAHAAGIVHRDLKPDNIFLETGAARPVVKVLDFGIAKLVNRPVEAQTPLTVAGGILGTPLYMSPEQCQGEGVDARSDVYSLGCVLYEMLTGRPPFVGGGMADMLRQHIVKAPEPPSRLKPDLPAVLELAVLRALAKQREDRFQTAGALAEALRRAGAAPETLHLHELVADSGQNDVPTAVNVPAALRETPSNLPERPLTLVGRDGELREIVRTLTNPDVQLLTLTGPGGTGKTRLAQSVGHELRPAFVDGIFFVDLAQVRDPALIAPAIAKELDVTESGGKPVDEALTGYLRGRTMLLVLDNFEQVLDAGPLLASLVAAAPRLKLLVTSRAILRLSVEHEFAVPPLALPDADLVPSLDELAACGSVRLFVERARTARRDFALTEENAPAVAEICRKLDGLPLAIELAAARIKVLTSSALLERLDERLKLLTGGARDLPARQRTMRGAVEWSYDLLNSDDKRAFERLAVFAGGGTLSIAEAVCGSGDGSELELLDAVESLIEKSLLRRTPTSGEEVRFRMLEVVREFALERLRESGDADEIERRHAQAYLELAERVAPEVVSTRAADVLDQLEEEHDNLRAALRWMLDRDAESCLRLAVALRHLWLIRGHLTEGRRWFETILDRSAAAPDALRSLAWRAVGHQAMELGDLAAARGHFDESLRIARTADDPLQVGSASYGLGNIELMLGDVPAARTCFNESLAVGRELGFDLLTGNALTGLGELARVEGEWATAHRLYREALDIARRMENIDAVSTLLGNLGAVATEEGDLDAAEELYTEALAIDRNLGSNSGISCALDGFAAIAAGRGDWTRAVRLAGAAEALRSATHVELQPLDRSFRDRYLLAVREHVSEADFDIALAEGAALTLDEAIARGARS